MTYKLYTLNNKLIKETDAHPHNFTGIIEYPGGTKIWYINGKRHRIDGPAVEYYDGTKQWFLNGKRHREDGPAIEFVVGSKEWFINGKCHRIGGPALEYVYGTKEWYINNKKVTELEHDLLYSIMKLKGLL